jgi:hypothetical protein
MDVKTAAAPRKPGTATQTETVSLMDALARAEAQLRQANAELEGIRARLALLERVGREQPDPGATDVPPEALAAFARVVKALSGERGLSVEAAERAALLATAAQAWEDELGALLSSADVRKLLGGVSRQRVDELLRARRLVGLRDSAGRRRFPLFQFLDGRPLRPLVSAYWTVADAAADEWTAASWCVSPDDALEGSSPAGWARADRDAERLARVALQDAARLAA